MSNISDAAGRRIRDLTGRRFGRLAVLKRDGLRSKSGSVMWSCWCDCGVVKSVSRSNLLGGSTVSCGCYRREINPDRPSKHPLWNIWIGMIRRCHDPREPAYSRYGEKGVSVCPQWRQSFPRFCEDVGPRPSTEHSLDRYPDNGGNYEPGNVRWATAFEQNRNRRDNRHLTYGGETMILTDWARRLGMSDTVIIDRLKRGWSIERSLTTPTLSPSQWSRRSTTQTRNVAS